ncbi:MAG TPA: 5'-nucleotidase [Myxococcaceae bacterium]|nr:5'-nucleotidase [Myxococcaceae bacterium]
MVLDAGNALFKPGALNDDASRERAKLILRTMGELNTAGMAVGHLDLGAGAEFLKKTAARANVPLLSANLVDSRGKLWFSPSRQLSVAGARVALIGISPLEAGVGFASKPPVQAALAEARKLRGKADVVLVLAAVPYADALQLAKEAGGAVDLILQSHEARGSGLAQHYGESFLVPTGERGRQLGRLELELAGQGPWVDAASAERDRQLINLLDVQIAEARKRLDGARPEAKDAAAQTLRSFESRRDSLAKQTMASRPNNGRSFKLDYLTLGTEYADDPALKAKVAAIEPQGAGP